MKEGSMPGVVYRGVYDGIYASDFVPEGPVEIKVTGHDPHNFFKGFKLFIGAAGSLQEIPVTYAQQHSDGVGPIFIVTDRGTLVLVHYDSDRPCWWDGAYWLHNQRETSLGFRPVPLGDVDG